MSAMGWLGAANAISMGGGVAQRDSGNGWLILGGFSHDMIPSTHIIRGIEILLNVGTTTVVFPTPGETEWRIQGGLSIDGSTLISAKRVVEDLQYEPSASAMGGPSDLWGRSWTPAEVNSSSFSLMVRQPPLSDYADEDQENDRIVDFAYVVLYHEEASGAEIMAERQKALQGIYIGGETTLGTEVAATHNIKGVNVKLDPNVELDEFRTDGDTFARKSVLNREWATVSADGKPDYNEIGWLLASVIGKPVTQLVTTGAYRHTFTLRTRSYHDPRGYTIWKGDDTGREKTNHVLFSEFAQSIKRSADAVTAAGFGTALQINPSAPTGANEVQTLTIGGSPTGGTYKLSFKGARTTALAYNAANTAIQTALQALVPVGAGNLLVTGSGPFVITAASALAGQLLDLIEAVEVALTGGTSPTATVTKTTKGGFSEYDLVPIEPGDWSVFYATTLAGLAAGQLTRSFGSDFDVKDRYKPVWAEDRSKPSYVAHVESEASAMVKLTLEADAAGMGYLTKARAGEMGFLKLDAVGPEVVSGVDYAMSITQFGEVSAIGSFGDEEGVYTLECDHSARFDPTWGRTLEIVLVNKVASY